MHVPNAPEITRAFGLGEPLGELVLVRRGDTDTWRLETTGGTHFVKGYWAETGGQFVAGGLDDQLRVAMAFEARALAAGVDMAEPVAPVDPVVGWATRIGDRLFRVHRWIESRGLEPGDDIGEWLGRTMAQVHQLRPVGAAGLPDIDWDSVRVDSAAREAGRVAYIFGSGELEPMQRILSAYVEAGGDVAWIGSALFTSVARNQLQIVREHVLVSLGLNPPARWMSDPEQTLTDLLTELPGKLTRLRQLSAELVG